MTDDALIEAMARAMFKPDQLNRLDIAKAALAVARPVIEAPLRAENEKLRAALKNIAETYNKPTTSKDGLAFMAAAALKETGNE